MRRVGTCLVAVAIWGGVAWGAAEPAPLDWRKDTYESDPPRLANPLRDATLSVSGQWSDRGPQYVTDGEIVANNHWACEQLPAVLTVAMREKSAFSACRIWFYFGEPRIYKFFIEASPDNRSWTRIADWTKNDRPATAEGFVVAFGKEVEAQYLRVTITDSSVRGAGGHIVELMVSSAALTPGLHGRQAPTDRIDDANATGDESLKTWRAAAWRNERVHGQFVVWSAEAVPQLRLRATALRSEKGAEIPASAVVPRFVRYVRAGKKTAGDILDPAPSVDLPAGGFRPVWLTVTVPAKTRPGLYRGCLTVKGAAGKEVAFPLELEVLGAKLPDPEDWAFFLDLWQHPWAVARYHGVAPFSPEHYRLLEPIYRELANAGQKTLTTTIAELPWNHQNFDAYHTMIPHVKNADGSWSFDYALFDEYVAFGKRCGLGPQIHCYTMAPWGDRVYYIDGSTGDQISVALRPGTPEHEAYWGPFLKAFQRHLVKKGWADDTYIAMDERGPEDTRATADCVKKFAPRLKIAMPGNHPPSHFKGIALDNYCQFIAHVDDAFLKEVPQRRAEGKVTTFYVCCGPSRPNTFTFSPADEQVWLGLYAAANGLDGFLRWAFVNWPRDPLFDSGFGPWPAGDTFLLYPGPRSSVRWEMLRDGIEESEKIRVLRGRQAASPALDESLSAFHFKSAEKSTGAALSEQVRRARQAVEDAARTLR
ncbi:MAG TPA: DUF6067 family protein [Kiritimatiellia bacterium]|nr:DUF6067 family protein [Kiritimatiellia bacterium]HPS06670.1 DUF6067 family protein [Kiritimatiellia bacterium]